MKNVVRKRSGNKAVFKKIFRIIFLISIFFIVIAILLSAKRSLIPWVDGYLYRLKFPEIAKVTDPENEPQCITRGGIWRNWGPGSRRPKCQISAKDGEKPCTSGFQCEYGACIGELNLRLPQFLGSGKCAEYKINFGCIQYFSFGIASRSVCLD